MFEQTKALCQHFLDLGIPGFDLIVYKDGECVLRHMGGYADPDKKIPMHGNERYHIYSCSKLVTCVAAMQLWEKGLFSLDDNLSEYLPAFADMTVKTENGIERIKVVLVQNIVDEFLHTLFVRVSHRVGNEIEVFVDLECARILLGRRS